MANRDGKGAKKNASKNFFLPNKKCPKCGSSLEKCDQSHLEGHKHHRYCKKCKYSNF